MNNLDKQYIDLIKDILNNGREKSDRTGTGTISVFDRTIRHKMSEGFPLITTKKVFFRGVVEELLWFLRGEQTALSLIKNNVHIWDGDLYKKYVEIQTRQKKNNSNIEILDKETFINIIQNKSEEPGYIGFANRWSYVGPIYGTQWRKWEGHEDQISNLLWDLKTNPDSRRLIVSAWNPAEIGGMILPPCHYTFQCYTFELTKEERYNLLPDKIKSMHDYCKTLKDFSLDKLLEIHTIPERYLSLKFIMRSNDLCLGLPFNLASYGLLLEILAKEVNMIPYELIANIGDCHIYKNQIEPIQEQLSREGYELPTLEIISKNGKNTLDGDISEYKYSDFKLINYKSDNAIKIPLSN